MTDREKELEALLASMKVERDELHRQLTDIQLKQLRIDVDDHEIRLRAQEAIGTRSNVLYALATGGGAIGVIVLIRTLISTP